MNNFFQKYPRLFDVISCRGKILACSSPDSCTSTDTCTGFHTLKCPCKESEIPDIEIEFVHDQREKEGTMGGKLIMVGVDSKETNKRKRDIF